MEKLQTLAWILIGLALFVWRMVQKARATTAREQRERKYTQPDRTGKPRPVAPSLPATSFEEMLRQMQAQNRGEQPRPAGPLPAPPAQTAAPAGNALPRSLEETPAPARSLERERPVRSLEAPRREARRAATLPRAAVQHGQEDYWSRQQAARPTPNSLAENLRNPANLRTAFILGEILQRRF